LEVKNNNNWSRHQQVNIAKINQQQFLSSQLLNSLSCRFNINVLLFSSTIRNFHNLYTFCYLLGLNSKPDQLRAIFKLA
jgi:hypothetical protein